MSRKQNKQPQVQCQICKEQFRLDRVTPAALVRDSIVEIIKREHTEWTNEGYICLSDLSHFRNTLVHEMLELEKGELTALEAEVEKSLQEHDILSKDVNTTFEKQLTFGERLADKLTIHGGSWSFIVGFIIMLLVWCLFNVWLTKPFDQYPFILLNLLLSCIAALQAPIIMMSQKRSESKDRMRAEHDYIVNLKAECEIRLLSSKIDQLIKHQWKRLMEVQEMQMELMEEIVGRRRKK